MNTFDQRRAEIKSSQSLGWVLAELRAVTGETQQQTADAVGLDRSQLAHLEAGRSGRYLANLLEVLNHLGANLVVEWEVHDAQEATAVATPERAKAVEAVKVPLAPPLEVLAARKALLRAMEQSRSTTEPLPRATEVAGIVDDAETS